MTEPIKNIMATGAVVTYMLARDEQGQTIQQGEFPHCAVWYLLPNTTPCGAAINVTDRLGHSRGECTRETGHPGSHVIHLEPGMPVLAWLEGEQP